MFNEICRIPARALNNHELVLMQRFRRYTFFPLQTSCVATGQSQSSPTELVLVCVLIMNFAHNLQSSAANRLIGDR